MNISVWGSLTLLFLNGTGSLKLTSIILEVTLSWFLVYKSGLENITESRVAARETLKLSF